MGISYTHIKNNKNNHTLLFLHGFTGNSSVWEDYVEALKDKFNIILVDLAGHGKSESPKTIDEYLFKNQAEKIVKLLDELGIQSVSIISYSFSCYIGLLIEEKMRGKVKNMVFIGPYFKAKFNLFETSILKSGKFIWRYLIPDKKYQLDYSKLKNYENPSLSDTRYTLKCTNTKDLLGSICSLLNNEGLPKLEHLKIPLLMIYGKNDKIISPEIKSLFKQLKNAKIVVMENKKHLFLKTETSKIAKTIRTFLAK
jgi:2-succinyl-6-hydroxy-2,4-cyclohexadiene-1-carboxylate synthase